MKSPSNTKAPKFWKQACALLDANPLSPLQLMQTQPLACAVFAPECLRAETGPLSLQAGWNGWLSLGRVLGPRHLGRALQCRYPRVAPPQGLHVLREAVEACHADPSLCPLLRQHAASEWDRTVSCVLTLFTIRHFIDCARLSKRCWSESGQRIYL